MILRVVAALLFAQFFPSAEKKNGADAPGATKAQFEVKDWTDTGIDVHPGDTLKIGATGTVKYANGVELTAAGGQKGP